MSFVLSLWISSHFQTMTLPMPGDQVFVCEKTGVIAAFVLASSIAHGLVAMMPLAIVGFIRLMTDVQFNTERAGFEQRKQ